MFKNSPELHEIWKERIEDFRASGKSMAQWSRDNNVPCHQTCYWKNIFPEGVETIQKSQSKRKGDFVEINDTKPTRETGIVIEINEYRIHVEPNFDEATFLKCSRLLRGDA